MGDDIRFMSPPALTGGALTPLVSRRLGRLRIKVINMARYLCRATRLRSFERANWTTAYENAEREELRP